MNKDKIEELIAASKLNELLHKKDVEESKKKSNVIIIVLAVIGAVAALAAIVYAIYRYFTPDYLDDFDDDFDDDDFDEDFEDDAEDLLKEIEKQAAKRDLEMPVLIQVNIAKEESKHGFEVEEIDEVFNSLKDYPHVKVRGLMMMAPHIESSETEKYFKMTQELLQRLQKDYPMYQLDQLSMGMSNDYHEALNHGSTMIRIGSALFK